MKRRPGLYPLEGKVKVYPIFGIDTETYNKNKNFLCASIVGDNYEKFFTSRYEIIKEIRTNQIFRNSYICATNLLFDLNTIYNNQEDLLNQYKVLFKDHFILASSYIPYNSKKEPRAYLEDANSKDYYLIRFIDSLSHFGGSVEELGKIIGLNKLDHPEFLGEKPKNAKEWEIMKAYNINDSKITYLFMKWLQNQYNNLNGNLKITASATAMDTFRRSYLHMPLYQLPRDIIDDLYKSYYGGRTENFKRGLFEGRKIRCYDVNSLYPYCMKNNEYPLINNYRRVAKVNTNDIDSYIGFADFTLKCPDIHIPILPVMNEKLKFPVGIIKGSYDFPSVKYAMDNGYELISAKNGIVFDNKFKPFKNYITDLYKKRMELKAEHNPVEIVVKLLMNGLYGKFALRYDNKEFLFTMNQLGYYVDNKNVDFTPITDTIFKGSTNEFSVIPNYVIPCFSSLTTAYARRYMHQQYKLTGFHRIYYTDTDCIFTDRVLETSNDLGALKIESEFLDLLLIKPKLYGGVTVDNKEKIKVKGVHKGIDGFKDFLSMVLNDNFTVKTEHWLKFKESIHKGEYCNKPGFITKTIDLQDDKRDWERLYFSTCPQDSNPLRFNYNDYKKI